jgi:hypothetical protein
MIARRARRSACRQVMSSRHSLSRLRLSSSARSRARQALVSRSLSRAAPGPAGSPTGRRERTLRAPRPRAACRAGAEATRRPTRTRLRANSWCRPRRRPQPRRHRRRRPRRRRRARPGCRRRPPPHPRTRRRRLHAPRRLSRRSPPRRRLLPPPNPPSPPCRHPPSVQQPSARRRRYKPLPRRRRRPPACRSSTLKLLCHSPFPHVHARLPRLSLASLPPGLVRYVLTQRLEILISPSPLCLASGPGAARPALPAPPSGAARAARGLRALQPRLRLLPGEFTCHKPKPNSTSPRVPEISSKPLVRLSRLGLVLTAPSSGAWPSGAALDAGRARAAAQRLHRRRAVCPAGSCRCASCTRTQLCSSCAWPVGAPLGCVPHERTA